MMVFSYIFYNYFHFIIISVAVVFLENVFLNDVGLSLFVCKLLNGETTPEQQIYILPKYKKKIPLTMAAS